MTPETLIHRYFLGEATEAEVKELDQLLANDPALRTKLIFEAGTDAGLREIALERIAEPSLAQRDKIISPVFRPFAWSSVAAAVCFFAMFAWSQVSRPKIIATLASVENATWEGSLPTEPGSLLTRGYLRLTTGIATIQLHSGVDITLEAPAKLMLKSPMRAKLVTGAAMIDVPKTAVGFTLETSEAYAVDYGTRFSVHAEPKKLSSNFEVFEGEISVHHLESGAQALLSEQQSVTATSSGLTSVINSLTEEPLPEIAKDSLASGVTVKATSIIKNNRQKWLHSDFLMTKLGKDRGDFERRALFSFTISDLDLDQVASARIRLNLVPSGTGFAARLPRINRFAIYGVTNEAKEYWQSGVTWEEAPNPKESMLLGRFEIPRSQQRGSFGLKSEKLLEFLNTDTTGTASFLLLRETSEPR